tara:strand:+ start:214 stop:396 length:183 start_codon:yes stop_codon:yes gene_type:complete
MTLKDIDLSTSETQQGNKGTFRMTAIDRGEYGNWLYTFKNEKNTFFKVQVDRFNNRYLLK